MQSEKKLFLFPVIFTLIQVFILSLGYLIGRIGFGAFDADLYKSIGFICLVFLLPYELSSFLQKKKTQSWYNSIPFLTLLTVLCIIPIGMLAYQYSLYTAYIFPTLGLLFLFRFIWQMFRQNAGMSSQIRMLILPSVIFGIWSIGDIWGTGVHSSLFTEGLAVGIGHVDTLFHISIAQMFKTYGTPSLGIDGILFLHYHYGSHILAASLSSLLNIPLVKIYNYTFPLLLAPLLSYTLVLSSLQLNKLLFNTAKFTASFWWIIPIGFIGIFPEKIQASFALWNTQFTSESYSLALSLSLLLISVVAQFMSEATLAESGPKSRVVLLLAIIPALLFLVGMSKISVGCLVFSGIGYLFLRFKLYTKPIYILSILISCITIGLAMLNYSSPNTNSSLIIEPFSFISTYVDSKWKIFFIPIYYAWVIIYMVLRLKSNSSSDTWISQLKNNSLVDIEVLLVFALAGFLPLSLLYISQANVAYFSDYQKWISLAMILAFALSRKFNFRENSGIFRYLVITTGVYLVLVLGTNVLNVTIKYVYDNYKTRNAIAQKTFSGKNMLNCINEPNEILQKNPHYKMINRLMELDQLPANQKRSSLLFIPQNDSAYWRLLQPNKIALLSPALTGIGSIDGTPPVLASEKAHFYDDYFFSDYSFRETPQDEKKREVSFVLREVKAKGKETLIVWSSEKDTPSFYH